MHHYVPMNQDNHINLVIIKNPFDIKQRELKTIKSESEIYLKKFLEDNVPSYLKNNFWVAVNGHVYKEEINLKFIRPGDYVVVCPVVQGGGNGSNPLAILAGLALAFFSFGMVQPWVAGMFGKTAGLLAGGLTMMAGGQLISNAFSPSVKQTSGEEATNHQWGELQSITNQGGVIPMTYGTIRTAGQILNQHITVQTDGETQYLEILYSGGEGVIDEFSDVRVNDNPIANYNDAEYFTRSGENTQSVISGFEKLYDSQSVNVTLSAKMNESVEQPMEAGEWHTVTLTGNTAEAVEVHLDFPEGLAFYRQNGDIDRFWVCMQFQTRYKLSGSNSYTAWKDADAVPVLDEVHGQEFINPETGNKRGSVTGGWRIQTKATSPISRVKKIYLTSEGQTLAGAEIQVRGRVFAKGAIKDNQKCRYKVQWSTATAVIPSEMTHPNKALMAVRIKATDQLNGGMPTITWRQTRRYVWVKDGGNWVQKDAQNPAWIIYDLCVQARRLDGVFHIFGEDPSRIDLAAFKSWAAWNDRKLDNRPPLKMNLLIDNAKSLFEWCNDIAVSARGAVVLRGTKISCIFDAPSEVVQMFTTGNIIAGSFSGEFLPVEERANAVEIAFNNEANNFEREQITIYADGFDNEDSRANPVSIELTGITTFEQAYAEGWYRLLQNKYILRTISFKAEIDALPCTVGDVITVQHDVPMWGQGGRILRKISDNVFMLDKEIIFDPSKLYVMNVRRSSDDKILSFNYYDDFSYITPENPEPGVTYLAIQYPNGIDAGDVFSIGEVNKVSKPFRIQDIKLDSDLKADITCTEYIAELYTQSTNIPVIDYTEGRKGIVNLRFASTGHYSTSGIWTPGLYALWNYLGTRPAGYEYQLAIDNEIWCKSYRTSDNIIQIQANNTAGTYHIRVRALYASGLPSEWSYADFESSEIRTALVPNAPTNLTAEGWFGFAVLKWLNPPNKDLHHIEIWEAEQDGIDNAVLVGTTRATSYTRLLKNGGALWFWVRAVNNTGQVSEFNSLAGTPCIISPENFQEHEEFIQELLENNPWLNDVFKDLDERIEPIETKIPDILSRIDNIEGVELPSINIAVREIKDIELPSIKSNISDIKNIEIPDIKGDINNINLDISGIKNIDVPKINTSIEALAEGILNNASSIEKAEDDRRNAIAVAKQELYKEITDTNEAVAGYRLELLGRIENNTALINSESKARTSADNAEAHEREILAGIVNNNSAAIETEQETRASADNALSQRITILDTEVGDNAAAIQNEITARTAADEAEAQQRQILAGQVLDNTAAIERETEARADLQSAIAFDKRELQVRLDNLDEAVLNNSASIHNESDWRRQNIAVAREELHAEITAEHEARATRELELLAAINGNTALIQEEQQARANAIEAEILARQNLAIQVSNNASAIQNEQTARVEADNAEAHERELLAVTVTNNTSAIQAEAQTRANANSALTRSVETLASTVSDNSSAIQAEIQTRTTNDDALSSRIDILTTSVGNNTAAIQAERQARADAIQAEAQQRETLASIVSDNSAAIQNEAQTRAEVDNATAQTIQTLQSDISENTAAIQTEQQTRATQDSALSSRIDTLTSTVGDNTTALQSEATARASADTALGKRIDTVISSVSSNTAAIQEEITARTTADEAEARQREVLAGQVANNKAAIEREAEARVDADSASSYERREFQARLDNLDEAVLNNSASIHNESDWRRQNIAVAREELHAEITAEHEARATRELELLAAINGNTALIQEEQQARANADQAEAHSRETLESVVNETRSALEIESRTRASADEALSQSISTLTSDVGDNTTAIQAEITARTTADEAEARQREILAGRVSDNTAAIERESAARADAKNADSYDKRTITARLDSLDEAVLTNSASVHNEGENRRQDIAYAREELHAEITAEKEARASRELELIASIKNNAALIQEEQIARANADSAESQARQTLASQVAGNTSAIQTEATTRANADSALATRTTTLESKVGSNTSGLIKRVDTLEADISGKASVSSVTTLQSTVNGHTTSIQTLNSVKDGVTGRHYVKIDNNGYVAGTELYNGGADQSSFVVSADHFNIRNPKNSNNVLDYNSSTGTLRLKNLVADSAIIQDASILRAKIGSNQITNNVGYVSAINVNLSLSIAKTICSVTCPCENGAIIIFSGTIFLQHVNSLTDAEVDVYFYRIKNSAKTVLVDERVYIPRGIANGTCFAIPFPLSAKYIVSENVFSETFKLDLTLFTNLDMEAWVGNLNALTLYR